MVLKSEKQETNKQTNKQTKQNKTKQNKTKQKQKQTYNQKKKVLSSFCNFSAFQFTIFLLYFSIFTPFPFFPCLFFPGRSAEISRSEVWEVLSPSPPPIYVCTNHNHILFRLEITDFHFASF